MYSNNTTESQPPRRQSSYEAIPQLTPIAVTIVLLNGVVFVLFFNKKSLRTPANYLLLSLAVSDTITGLVNIPLFLCIFVPVVQHSTWNSLRCLTDAFHRLTSISAAYHITAVTAEKYLGVVRPFRRHVITTRGVLKTVLAVWLCSALLGTIPISFFYKRDNLAMTLRAAYDMICLAVVFLIPYVFILYANTVMFKAVSGNKSGPAALVRNGSKSCGKVANERKCLIVLSTMALFFLVCWMPWFILVLVYTLMDLGWIHRENLPVIEILAHVFLIVRYLSSAINPLLYTFFKQDFWNAFQVVILRKGARRLTLTMISLSRKRKNKNQEQVNRNLLNCSSL